MSREPLVTVGVITAFVAAVFAVLVSFGVPVTDEQQNAILSLIAVVAPIAVALLARPKVTPVQFPQDSDGMPLVRADGAPRHRA